MEWRAAEERDKSFIKGQRYNLFRNPGNLIPEQEISLKELLAMNENLNKAYVLKDALKVLWTYTYAKSADKYIDKWISWAMEKGTRFSRSSPVVWTGHAMGYSLSASTVSPA